MLSLSRRSFAGFAMLVVLGLFAVVFPSGGRPAVAGPAPAPKRYWVYRDAESKENNGHWTNVMPAEGAKMLKLNMAWKTDPNAGATCVRVDIKWQEPLWCGLAVSSQPDYWGEDVKKEAFDLSGAKKLVFHARGAAGGEYIQVKCAITGDKKFGDSAKGPAESEWIKLDKSWKAYEVDLSKTNLKRVVTPFCFVSNKDYNDKDITFFLDDISIDY